MRVSSFVVSWRRLYFWSYRRRCLDCLRLLACRDWTWVQYAFGSLWLFGDWVWMTGYIPYISEIHAQILELHHIRSYGLLQSAAICLATYHLAAEGQRSSLKIPFNGDWFCHTLTMLGGQGDYARNIPMWVFLFCYWLRQGSDRHDPVRTWNHIPGQSFMCLQANLANPYVRLFCVFLVIYYGIQS